MDWTAGASKRVRVGVAAAVCGWIVYGVLAGGTGTPAAAEVCSTPSPVPPEGITTTGERVAVRSGGQYAVADSTDDGVKVWAQTGGLNRSHVFLTPDGKPVIDFCTGSG